MQIVTVAGERGSYDVVVDGGALGRLGELLDARSIARPQLAVTDATVAPLHGRRAAAALGIPPPVELPDGEAFKCWQQVEGLLGDWLDGGLHRGESVLAVGGGVVTDMAGFAAAVTLRGMPWVAIPTTLLGMVDAAIGGKTGFDLDVGKNLVGAFWPPRAVIADPLALATLDGRQLRAGLAEVVKSAMIAPSTLEHVLDANLAPVAAGDPLRAQELIVGCVRVKADIVAADERESGPRRALNLGHTLAHGLEAATRYRHFLHGEAVAWGLLAELRLARDRGLLSTAEAQAWAERIRALAPLPGLAALPWEEVSPFVARDKKRQGGRVSWVLPRMGGVVLDVAIGEEEAAAVYAALATLPPEGPFSGLF